MKAAVIDAFGPESLLEVREVPKPEISDDEMLVEVHASSVNPIDWKIGDGMMGDRYGDEFPMILGLDASGVVVGAGANVTGFKVGDEVFGRSTNGTGKCYAEFVVLNPETVVQKPEQISHAEAAAMPLAALTALNGLKNFGALTPGQRVLIIGGSGGVGTYAVQIAKNIGAEVTAVCSTGNVDLVRELGADRVIDYTQQDPLETDAPYDLIYDTVGVLKYPAAREKLTDAGVYLRQRIWPYLPIGCATENYGRSSTASIPWMRFAKPTSAAGASVPAARSW
jgi:2-desacetyl-2-hydroxyethyl bacteriochlorophyllide A dehydrogenase